MWLFDLCFPQFCKSDISKYGYIEVFQESLGLRDNKNRLCKQRVPTEKLETFNRNNYWGGGGGGGEGGGENIKSGLLHSTHYIVCLRSLA